MYDKLFSRLSLSDDHRQELVKKRGFNSKIIKSARFVSGSPENEKVVLEMSQDESVEDMEHKQILVNGDVNEILLHDKVIIPSIYNGRIEYFRCHKYGLAGITPPLYVPPVQCNDPRLIIAESEFKALALAQWGYRAIGVCGISMYIKDNYDKLEEMINSIKVNDVYILWDNEDKVSSDSPYYKDDPKKRYAVEACAYIMAKKIRKIEGCNCRIAQLPDSWRVNGGIDLDAALAAGKTKADIEKLLLSAVSPDQYRSSWEKECMKYASRTIDRHFYVSPINESFGRYTCTKRGEEIPISNFTLEIVHNYKYETEEGPRYERGLRVIDQYGQKSPIFEASPSDLSNVRKFKELLMAKGSYVFRGTQGDMDAMIEKLMMFDDNPTITRPMVFGWDKNVKAYLMGNMVIYKDKILEPDGDGVVWIEGEGVKQTKLSMDDGKNMNISLSRQKVDVSEAVQNIVNNWGNKELMLACGWSLATIFADAVVNKYGMFPMLFLNGTKEFGKTTLAELMCDMQGARSMFKSDIEGNTVASMERTLARCSNLIVWMDEYKASNQISKKWDTRFRSIYNRQGSMKADKNSQSAVVMNNVLSCLMISGEVSPNDSALATRFIRIDVNKFNESTWNWITKHRDDMSSIYWQIAVQREKMLGPFMSEIEAILKHLTKNKEVSERYAINYSVAVAALTTFAPASFGGDKEAMDFIKYLENHLLSKQQETNTGHISISFIRDLLIMREGDQSRVTDKAFYLCDDKVYMHVPTAYSLWRRYLREIGQYDNGWTQSSISKCLKDSGWDNNAYTYAGVSKCRAHRIEIKRIKDPELVEELKEACDAAISGLIGDTGDFSRGAGPPPEYN